MKQHAWGKKIFFKTVFPFHTEVVSLSMKAKRGKKNLLFFTTLNIEEVQGGSLVVQELDYFSN